MANQIQQLSNRVREIKRGLHSVRAEVRMIKKRIADDDLVLSLDDLQSLEEAEEDLKSGRTKRLI